MRVQFNLFSLLIASNSASAGMSYNMTPGVTPLSHDIYSLHMLIFWICVAIGVLVFGVMLYAIIFHRKSRNHKPYLFHEHTWLELGWTIIPFFILVAMAIPATLTLIEMNDTEKEDLTIKITGFQWKWRYEYLGQNISFFSNANTPRDQINGKKPKTALYLMTVDHPLVVPVHKKIRFLMTSNDVIHSWWVPALGVKRDALPGFINEAWARINRAGTYYGQCTELCGMNHAYMPIVVEAMSEQGFQQWLAKQKGETESPVELQKQWTLDELKKRGEEVYMGICAACHQPTGNGIPPTFPSLNGSALVNGPVAGHIDRVMNGKPGTAMQAFKNQLSDVEIAAVITYERNSWGNKTGTSVQPIEIKALREGKTVDQVKAALLATAPNKTPVTPAAVSPTTSAVPSVTSTTSAPTASTATIPAAPPQAANATPPNGAAALSQQQLMEKGQVIFENTCATCHQLTGEGMPPTYPPLKGSALVNGPVEDHINRVMNGKPGTAMQVFKDQFNDEDLAAVITYERNSWGNNAGHPVVVQPSDIAAARAKLGATP